VLCLALMEDMPLKQIEIPKPFKSGSCQICHGLEYSKERQLCPACEKYVSQDHVPNRALTMGSDAGDGWIKSNSELSSWEAVYESFDGEYYRERIYQLLRNTGLTAQQRQIVRLFFGESLSHTKISKKLELSASSVRSQFQRAMEKLKICRENPLLVKERVLRTLKPKPSKAKVAIPKENFFPVKIFQPDENGKLKLTQIVYPTKRKHFPRRFKKRSVYAHCGRCGAKAYLVDQDFYYCMDCSWTSDTHGGLTVFEERKLISPTEESEG
jgi:RNA polymerase sigma factor (sigma-70 family)